MSEEQAPVTEEVAQEQTEDVSRETTEQTEQAVRPEIIPEKFWNAETGEINVGDLAHSYNNLEKMVSGKQDAMREQVMAELTEEARSQAPEEPSGYNLPPLVEGITEEMVESNPMTAWWRDQCYERGYSEEDFQDGINKYIETMMSGQPNLEAEVERLGENATDRLNAVNAWASSYFPPEEYEVLAATLGQSAEGITILERMQAGLTGNRSQASQVAQPERELGIDDVKQMMNDKRYFDQRHRDPAYVKKVDDAWNRLNLSGKV